MAMGCSISDCIKHSNICPHVFQVPVVVEAVPAVQALLPSFLEMARGLDASTVTGIQGLGCCLFLRPVMWPLVMLKTEPFLRQPEREIAISRVMCAGPLQET